MKKTNGKTNGKKNELNVAMVQPLDEPKLVAISESDLQSLTEVNSQLTNLKVALADVDLQREQLDTNRQEILAAIKQKNAELQNTAKVVARSHGINPESQKWQIDLKRAALIHL